jgi:hypothetical protein
MPLLSFRPYGGPVQRNFRHDYDLAMQCLADPALPMRDVAVLLKTPATGLSAALELPEPRGTFSSAAEFKQCLAAVLAGWKESLLPDADLAR